MQFYLLPVTTLGFTLSLRCYPSPLPFLSLPLLLCHLNITMHLSHCFLLWLCCAAEGSPSQWLLASFMFLRWLDSLPYNDFWSYFFLYSVTHTFLSPLLRSCCLHLFSPFGLGIVFSTVATFCLLLRHKDSQLIYAYSFLPLTPCSLCCGVLVSSPASFSSTILFQVEKLTAQYILVAIG